MISTEPIDLIPIQTQCINAINIQPHNNDPSHYIVDVPSYCIINTCPLDTVAATRLIEGNEINTITERNNDRTIVDIPPPYIINVEDNNIIKGISNKMLQEIVTVIASLSVIAAIIVIVIEKVTI